MKMKLFSMIMILFLFSITINSISAVEIQTNTTADGGLNKTITDAQNNDKIKLDQGTYTNNVTGIVIDKNLTIVGKDPKNTIIDAQSLDRIFFITEGNTLTLINITLINGRANDGGAIYNDQGKLTIENCIFSKNNVMHYGGAIFSDNGELNIKNSIFSDNYAISGGGAISNGYGHGSENIIYQITNSKFVNNSAAVGGAIYNANDNIMTITNCEFINNTAFSNGGAVNNYADDMIIKNSIFTNNKAEYTGGAISNYGNNISILNSKFSNNSVLVDEFDGGGGAIANMYSISDITINNCEFTNNTANGRGGAIYNVFVENINISNCNFTNNKANDTGAIYNEDVNNMLIIGCNIINNSHGIKITGDSTNNTINYNRIFNNTYYDLNNSANEDADINYNWWGSNNPGKIIGNDLNNYFVMNVINLTSLKSNGTVTFKYTFKLNTNDQFNANLLPYFVTSVYTNLTGKDIIFDARFDKTFDINVNKSEKVLYTFITDNEVQNLEGKAVITPTPKPNPNPKPNPTPKPNPVPIPNKPSNSTKNNNEYVKASMKQTGIPIIAIILVLLSSLTLTVRKK